MKEKIKRNILPITFAVLLFTLIFTDLLKRFPTNLDELWNFNTARCIKNGLIPYKDISMITTPLLPTIVSVLLRITADQLLVFRVLHALLICGIFYLSYKIFLKYKVNKYISIIFTGLIVAIYYKQTFLDYNYFCLFLMLIIENIELKSIEDNKNRNILIGLLAGLSILTKQTLGVFICLYSIMIPLLLNINRNRNENKNKNKKVINTLLFRILGISIPCIVFLLYLLITNSFIDFINYALLGIKTFSNSINYVQMIKSLKLFEKVIALSMPFVFLMEIILAIYLKNKKYFISLLSSLPMLIVLYPICDYTHFLVGTLIVILNLFISIWLLINKIKLKINDKKRNIDKNINKNLNENKNKEKDKDINGINYDKIIKQQQLYTKILKIIVIAFALLLFLFYSLIYIRRNIMEYKKIYNENYSLAHYDKIPITKNNIQMNKELNEFYKKKQKEGYNVILVDADACFYTIPLEVYNKNYDMFLKGNIGKDGEDGIIENIKSSSKTIYLLKNKGISLNWQTPTKVLDYIRNNLEKTEEFNIFEVWKKD